MGRALLALALVLAGCASGERQPVTDFNWPDAAEDHDARALESGAVVPRPVDLDSILDARGPGGG